MSSDPDRHGEGPGVPAMGSAGQVRRHLQASRGLCPPGSPMLAVINAHLAALDAAPSAGLPRRPAAQDP